MCFKSRDVAGCVIVLLRSAINWQYVIVVRIRMVSTSRFCIPSCLFTVRITVRGATSERRSTYVTRTVSYFSAMNTEDCTTGENPPRYWCTDETLTRLGHLRPSQVSGKIYLEDSSVYVHGNGALFSCSTLQRRFSAID